MYVHSGSHTISILCINEKKTFIVSATEREMPVKISIKILGPYSSFRRNKKYAAIETVINFPNQPLTKENGADDLRTLFLSKRHILSE